MVALTGGIKRNILNEFVPSMASTERVLLAKKLSLDINKPLIISGGKTMKEAPSEAFVTSKYLNLENIILEEDSLNTFQSSLNIKKTLLKQEHINSSNYRSVAFVKKLPNF